MLSTEAQKNRLEDLLVRVQRNRIRIEKERSATAKRGSGKAAAIAAVGAEDSGRLPLPAEPSPESISSIPPAAAAPAPLVSLESTLPHEPEPAIRKPRSIAVPTAEQESPDIGVIGEEPSVPPAHAAAEASTFTPDPDSGIVSADAPTIQPRPEVVRQVFHEASPPREEPAQTVRVYQGDAVASGDVAVVHGEIAPSWSLGAVLTRAWKLGLSK